MTRKTDREKYADAVWRQGEPRRQKLLAQGTPNRHRITLALDYRMLDGPEVDVWCGGKEPMVDMWEAGTLVPTGEQVMLLAALTQYPVEWFYKDDPPEMTGPMFMCGDDGCEKGLHVGLPRGWLKRYDSTLAT